MERRRPSPPLPPLQPEDLLYLPMRLVEELDSRLRKLDEVLREFDSRVLSRQPEQLIRWPTAGAEHREEYVYSPSYPGQSPESACLECLTRHYLKALGLLEEAERFSINRGEITPEARQRIELALKEIVTAEEDLAAPVRDPELARMIDEIKAVQREFRKWMWTERLLTTQRDLAKLREAISRMKWIVDLTRRAAEYYDSRYGRCPYCEQLAKEVSEKFGVSESEALEAVYGATSDDRERAARSIEKLRKMGALDYVVRRAEEMLREMREGR
ncbi:MAG: hypothetical protein QXU69_04625 [Thermofilaceae archaeon]